MTAQLGYWNIRGLAAPIRMLLYYCDVPFADVQYEQGSAPDFSTAAWLDEKHALGLLFPNLPYYIDDGGKFVQTLPILRYIAARHGVIAGGDLGHNDSQVDVLAHVAMDLRNAFTRCCYRCQSMAEVERAVAEHLRPQILCWSQHLADGRSFCAGDRLSYADFFLAEHLDQIRQVFPAAVQPHTALCSYIDRFFGLDKLQQFQRTSLYMKWPVNNKRAFLGSQPAP